MYIYSYYAKDGTLLYIGSTGKLLQRFRQHKQEEGWMVKVASISVRGPYTEKTVAEYERLYVSRYQPVYNTNLIGYEEYPDFVDDREERYFSTVAEFEDYYSLLPNTYQRATYYLKLEDLEALRLLQFYCNEDRSEIVRQALKIGFETIAEAIGHNNIYEEAVNSLLKSNKYKELKHTSL